MVRRRRGGRLPVAVNDHAPIVEQREGRWHRRQRPCRFQDRGADAWQNGRAHLRGVRSVTPNLATFTFEGPAAPREQISLGARVDLVASPNGGLLYETAGDGMLRAY